MLALLLMFCTVLPSFAQKCGCTDCSFCAGKKPCVDLVQERQYHHYMYLESKGVAIIDGESDKGAGDNREWKCLCRTCDGLVGTWRCGNDHTDNGFYGRGVVKITSDTNPKPNFLDPSSTNDKFSVDVCFTTPVTSTATTSTITTITTTISSTTNTIDAELARQKDKYSALELQMEKQILESQNKISGLAAQVGQMQTKIDGNSNRVDEYMFTANSRMQELENANQKLKAMLALTKKLLPDNMDVIESGVDHGTCKRGNGECTPFVESTADGKDLTLSASMGKVLVDTAECGILDLCNVRQALASVSNALASLADLE